MMTPKNVLVIDDVSVIRSFVKAALRSLPIDFREASDGTKGLEMHNGSRADLIICDMNMPAMNGEAFLRALRESGDLTPLILLTAESDMGVLGRLIKLGKRLAVCEIHIFGPDSGDGTGQTLVAQATATYSIPPR